MNTEIQDRAMNKEGSRFLGSLPNIILQRDSAIICSKMMKEQNDGSQYEQPLSPRAQVIASSGLASPQL